MEESHMVCAADSTVTLTPGSELASQVERGLT